MIEQPEDAAWRRERGVHGAALSASFEPPAQELDALLEPRGVVARPRRLRG